MSRIEVRAAWVMGVMLPLMETLRRRTDFSEFWFYIDDYIAGGILLFAAWAADRRWYGRGLLIGAWGILCGGLYGSFFGQIAHLGQDDISGLPSSQVAVVKGAALLVSLGGLVMSIKRLRP